MLDEKTLAQINGKYECPPDAGPAWRDAMDLGLDMSLVELNLTMTPWERLLQNDQALSFIRDLQDAAASSNGKAH